MLIELTVEDLGVIDRAEVSFEGGCIAVTGETGAGKTLLVRALGLLLGARSDRDTVRSGAAEARVEGRYVVASAHPAVALFAEAGVVEPDGGDEVELVVVRTVPASGRGGKARVNGRLVPASLLAKAGALLTEVAGQHEHQRIGAPAWQRDHLDAWAGPDVVALADDVRAAVADARAWEERSESLKGSERERRRALDLLRYEISEIESAAPEPGEMERLAEDATRLEHAEAIAEGLARAGASLTDDGAAQDLINAAAAETRALVAGDPRLEQLAARLESAALEVGDVAAELARNVAAPDPEALDATQQRISVLGRLRRKYGADEGEVLRYLDDARTRAAELAALEEGVDEAVERATAARAAAVELAGRLSRLRRQAAARLAPLVEQRLASLALEGSTFVITVDDAELHEGGLDSVEYLVSFNAGEPPAPVRKVASGGELSRLGLALALTGSRGSATTIVFDEVDAGVGGEAARSVGAALAELAETTAIQVMVVTHLPQVAAFAGSQYRIEKQTDGARSTATVKQVSGAERIEELSRMLAGMPGSESARGHAEELLEHAARLRAESVARVTEGARS